MIVVLLFLAALGDPGSKTISVAAEAGVGFPSYGGASVPRQITARFGAGVPIALTKGGGIEPGISVSITPLPWARDTEWQTAVLANMLVRYHLASWLDARIDVGAGGLFVSRFDRGNPFTDEGRRASGSTAMVHLRGSFGVDFWLNDVIALSATPFSFGVSPPKSGLRRDIILVHQVDLVGGLRVQL